MNKRRVNESHKYRGNQAIGVCVRTNLLRGLTTKVREQNNVEMAETEFPVLLIVCFFCCCCCFHANLLKFSCFVSGKWNPSGLRAATGGSTLHRKKA